MLIARLSLALKVSGNDYDITLGSANNSHNRQRPPYCRSSVGGAYVVGLSFQDSERYGIFQRDAFCIIAYSCLHEKTNYDVFCSLWNVWTSAFTRHLVVGNNPMRAYDPLATRTRIFFA